MAYNDGFVKWQQKTAKDGTSVSQRATSSLLGDRECSFKENATASAHSNQTGESGRSAAGPTLRVSRLLDGGKWKTATGASYGEVERGPRGAVKTRIVLGL